MFIPTFFCYLYTTIDNVNVETKEKVTCYIFSMKQVSQSCKKKLDIYFNIIFFILQKYVVGN